MTKTIVAISDTQLPYEDRKAVRNLIRFIGEFQPDEVAHVGDLMDYPQPSRWSKDTRAEFEGSIYADSEYAKRSFLEPLRAVYDGPVGILEGNHDERPRVYADRYSPALANDPRQPYGFEQLLDFDGFGVMKLPEFYTIAPEWVFTHGHRGNISLSQISGNTATNAAKKFGKSVMMGHTHRAGIGFYSAGYGQEVGKQLCGVELGNLMDMRKAQYLKGGTANWQQAFGVMRVDGKHVQVEVVNVHDGKFIVDGETYP